MTYQDYYLKFPDEETQKQFYDPENMVFMDGFNVSVIGVIYDNGDLVNQDGFEYYQQIAQPGWHVNMQSKLPLPDELSPYQIFPISPTEVWL